MKFISFYKALYVITITFFTFTNTNAQIKPYWVQQSKISPDGKWIAFEYQGNIFKVPSSGGSAIRLTTNSFYSGYPVWSHNSQIIAFAALDHGNFDIYAMKATGGKAKRITFDSSRDIPYDFSADNSKIFFGTDRHDVFTSVRFPADNVFTKLFAVPVNGGKSIMINSAGMENARINKKGDELIFQDKKGRENNYRKHHKSIVTRDIWTYNLKSKKYSQVSSFSGEDLEPLWGEQNTIYYLSERSGSLNLYKGLVNDSSSVKQLTTFQDHPVRYFSRSNNGKIAFTYNGELYTLEEGSLPKKINIALNQKSIPSAIAELPVKGEITQMTVSNDGKQIAFISRGDVFVASEDGLISRRITSTPYQERTPRFSPDGKKILYSVEHANSWDIEQAALIDSDDIFFYNDSKFSTEKVIATDKDEFQGIFSPDGTQIAYLENRDVLKSYNLATKKEQIVLAEGVNFSSEDGDQYFTWSPDGQYLLSHSKLGSTGYDNEILLIKNDGTGKFTNLSKSGFKDDFPQWTHDGKMIYWLSDRDTFRNFTEGSEKDIYAIDFDLAPGLQKEGDFLLKKLSTFSSDISACVLSAADQKLFYLNKYEDKYDLWITDTKSGKSNLFLKLDLSDPKMEMTRDGKSIFILCEGNIIKINTENALLNKLDINSIVRVDLNAERSYIFDHVCQMVKKRFMDPLAAKQMLEKCEVYKQFVSHINNDYDFSIMLNEFLGELNTSHTGSGFYPINPNKDDTAALGLLYDQTWNADGLVVKEVISEGPFDVKESAMKKNMIVDTINGIALGKDFDWSSTLNKRAGKPTEVTFHNPKDGKSYQETIIPVDLQTETSTLLYNRWVRRMEHLTDSLSQGRLGYVHVRIMNDAGMRMMYDKALGKYRNAHALIVDTRFNRGGSLHDELTTFLNGKLYLTECRQGKVTVGGEPFKKWTKPSVILMSEGNYSDAYLTPYTYRYMGIGKLIGMPVAGTGTGSWFEEQVNKQLTVQIATAATYFTESLLPNENHQLDPDIRVLNEYNQILKGEDQQLERAVSEMLKEISISSVK